MLTKEYEIATNKQYGRIYPLRWGFYANPQMFMFIFTLILTVTLSFVMINFVFIEIYHKVIGTTLCLYITYRFVSLGLSNPGLAVQSIDQRLQYQFLTNNQLKIDSTEIQSQVDTIQVSSIYQQPQNLNFQLNKQNQTLRNKIGFHGYCNECKILIQYLTKHCKTCKTCIDSYDHHCIWIGKCIGKKNMWQFKQFLCFVFITLIYSLILSIQTSKIQKIS